MRDSAKCEHSTNRDREEKKNKLEKNNGEMKKKKIAQKNSKTSMEPRVHDYKGRGGGAHKMETRGGVCHNSRKEKNIMRS